jgi:hypothetical protein
MNHTPTPLQKAIESFAISNFFCDDEEGLLAEILRNTAPRNALDSLGAEEWDMLNKYAPYEDYWREELESRIDDMYDAVADLFDRVVASGILQEKA